MRKKNYKKGEEVRMNAKKTDTANKTADAENKKDRSEIKSIEDNKFVKSGKIEDVSKSLKLAVGLRIKEFGKTNFESLRELARKLNISPQNLHQYVSGKIWPGGEILKKLQELGADVNYILTGKRFLVEKKEERIGGYDFPLVSKLSAGSMIEFFADDSVERVSFAYHKQEGCMALSVRGDSMLPTIENGDVVLVDSSIPVYDGCIVAARLKNGEQLIKRFRKLPDNYIQLDSDNFMYEPITIKIEDVELLMPVVKIQRDIYKKRS